MRYFKFTLGMLVIGLMASALNAEDYAIKFDHPMKIGDKYTVSGSATEDLSKTISNDGKVIRDQKSNSKVAITADLTVLKVNKRGRPTAVKGLILNMNVEHDGRASASLPKKSVVDISVVGKKQICRMKGKKLPPVTSQPLNSVIKLAKFDSTDDDVFGTKKRIKVGEQWDVNKQRMITDMATTGLQLTPENIEGYAKLLKTTKVDDNECILVETEFELNKLSSPRLPPTLKIKKADMKVKSLTTLPIDDATPQLASDDTMTINLVMEGAMNPKAPKMKIEVRNEKRRTLKYTYETEIATTSPKKKTERIKK